MPASEIELKNSPPDPDLKSGRRETSALHVSRQCGYWFSPVMGVITLVKYVFTALHGMQTRYNDEKAVPPSVRPYVPLFMSHAWIVTKRKICPNFHTTRYIV